MTSLCFTCRNIQQELFEGYYVYDKYGRRYRAPETYEWYCQYYLRYIHKFPKTCKHYNSIHQTKLKKGDDKMVKIEELESGTQRGDLANITEGEYRAVREYTKEPSSGQTGGLCIVYEDRKGIQWTQKYTVTLQPILMGHCQKLKILDTIELQNDWYMYVLKREGRAVYPRLFPIKKVK